MRKTEPYRMLLQELQAYYAEHPCVICDEKDPALLEFDIGQKSMNIKSLRQAFKLWGSVKEEIATCEVRCTKCRNVSAL